MDSGLVRRHTASVLKLMNIIYHRAPITRRALEETSSFSHPTIIQDVNRLIAADLVYESPMGGKGRGGSRAAELRVKTDDKFLVSVEVRSNLFIGIVMDFGGRVLHRTTAIAESRECDRTVSQLLALVEKLLEQVPAREGPRGICVAFPGSISSGKKVVHTFHGRKGWENFPLAKVLENRFGVESFVLNNSGAYIRAEKYFVCEPRERNLLGIYLDNGMGMGIVVNGAVYEGETFAAGEIGHLQLGDAAEACHCGRHGCLERFCSQVYLLEKLNARLGTSWPTLEELLSHSSLSEEDEKWARGLIDEGLRILSRGISTAVTLLNPSRVLVHGGIVALAKGNVDGLRQAVLTQAFPASTNVSVELSTLDETACAVGAGVFFIERFYDVKEGHISEELKLGT